MASPSILTPLQLIAGAQLTNNNGVAVAATLIDAITDYRTTNLIAPLAGALSNSAAANLSNAVMANLTTLSATNCPALSDSTPSIYAPYIGIALGNAALGNSKSGFTGGVILTFANAELGNGITSDFCQIFSASVGYVSATNEFINSSLNSQTYLGSTFTSMNSLTTGNLTDVNQASKEFGQDLVRLGQLIDLNNLENLGSPAALLKQMSALTGIIPSVKTSLIQAGIDVGIVDSFSNPSTNFTDSVQKKLYQAMTTITGTSLSDVLSIFDIQPVPTTDGGFNFGPIPETIVQPEIPEPVVTNDNTNWVFNQSSPSNDRYEYLTTTAGDFNIGAGIQTFQFTFKSSGYFANNTNGHFAVVLRCNNSAISSGYVQGQGIVIGNVSGAPYPSTLPPGVPFAPNPSYPSSQIESFWAGLNPYYANTLLANTNGANPILADGIEYVFTITSKILENGKSYTGYKITQDGALVYYQPPIYDYNIWYDATKTGIVIGHVFETSSSPWSVTISNKIVTWSSIQSDGPTPYVPAPYIGNNVKNMAELLDPKKLFPNSYKSLTVTTNSGLRGIYTPDGAVNTNLVQYLPSYILNVAG